MKLQGSLFIYDTSNKLICFDNNIESETSIVFIGGLGCNIFSQPYTEHLYKFCKMYNIRLLIPQLRSHPNYFLFGIEDDIEDVNNLLKGIKERVILLGNSTGCQDIMLYLNKFAETNVILSFLQAPVSDVEYQENIDENLSNHIVDCRKNHCNFYTYNDICYLKERFLSLFERNNTEDLFSSYLGENHYKSLNKNNHKIVFIVSRQDEYTVIPIYDDLKKVKNSEIYCIRDADHMITSEKCMLELFEIVKTELIKNKII